MSFDVAVVGAGIIGAACANEAARAGLRVVVIEQHFPASGASGAAMGHVVLMDGSEAQFALTRFGRELWAELAGSLPRECEYVSCGTIWVAADEAEMTEVRRKRDFYMAYGAGAETLDPRQLSEAEPSLRQGLAGALFVRHDSVLDPPCAVRYLLEHANITSRTGRAISIKEKEVLLSDGSRVSAAWVINAAGTAARQLTPEIPIPIEPRKGHLLLAAASPGFVRHQVVELGYLKSAHSMVSESVAFNVQPRANGQVLIGSSRQFGSQTAEVEPDMLDRMMRRAVEYMPGIAGLSTIRAWTGFRAATPDKLPVIGPVPGLPGVFAATGHEGLGITTALATGRLIVDQILGRVSAISPEPYSAETLIHS